MNFGRVAVLLGGRSGEREISLKSGNAVLQALISRGVDAQAFDPARENLEALAQGGYDNVFIALHGRYGEDGTIQGALELLNLPYTGSGVAASAIAMDKWRTKLIWQSSGIPTPRFALIDERSDLDKAADDLGLPLIIKPSREGSTIGLTKVLVKKDLRAAYVTAARHDSTVLAEQFISGAELTVPILRGAPLPIIRIEAASGLYDYEAKYLLDTTRYFCPCGLPADEERQLQALALKSYELIGCRGWGRVDLLLDAQGGPHFLEVNTIPGMTDHSLVPMSAKASGLSFEDLVLTILEDARLD
ncbi:MAG: D-alanine--D-alanine ligase [Burkholderiales bacterium]